MSKRAGIQDEKVRKTEEVWECLVGRGQRRQGHRLSTTTASHSLRKDDAKASRES